MSIFLQRVREFAKAKNLSLRAMSIAAGQSESYLSNSIKQGSIPSAEILSNIIDKYPSLNPYWVLTGKGEMELEVENHVEAMSVEGSKRSIDDIIDEKIDKKIEIRIKTLADGIRELIMNEMEDELEATREELRKESKKGGVK